MKIENFKISITGLGIIFYSPKATEHIADGEKYLLENYNAPEDVIRHIYEGSIVGIGTGTPGDFYIHIYQEQYPDIKEIEPEYALKLCLQVTDNVVYFRDLYVLLRWEKENSEDIKIDLENGLYEIIVCSWLPKSGIRGDNQLIEMYFNKVNSLPKLFYKGVPSLILSINYINIILIMAQLFTFMCPFRNDIVSTICTRSGKRRIVRNETRTGRAFGESTASYFFYVNNVYFMHDNYHGYIEY